jgi:transposase
MIGRVDVVENHPKLPHVRPDAPTRAQRDALLAERRAEMWRMRVDGWTQQQIAAHYGVSQSAVSQQLAKAYKERPAAAIDEYRAIQLDKLDQAEREALAVMRRRHYVVSQGRIVTAWSEETGQDEPLLDDGPILASIDRIVKISKRRSELLGLDAPTRISVEAERLADEITSMLTAALPNDDDDPDDES